MADPNEPRRMTPRRDQQHVYDNATGDAGCDGYTRIARRQVPGRQEQANDGAFPMFGGSDEITPQVGERDWNRGPRFSEDF